MPFHESVLQVARRQGHGRCPPSSLLFLRRSSHWHVHRMPPVLSASIRLQFPACRMPLPSGVFHLVVTQLSCPLPTSRGNRYPWAADVRHLPARHLSSVAGRFFIPSSSQVKRDSALQKLWFRRTASGMYV